jgi:hypothetical protein
MCQREKCAALDAVVDNGEAARSDGVAGGGGRRWRGRVPKGDRTDDEEGSDHQGIGGVGQNR